MCTNKKKVGCYHGVSSISFFISWFHLNTKNSNFVKKKIFSNSNSTNKKSQMNRQFWCKVSAQNNLLMHLNIQKTSFFQPKKIICFYNDWIEKKIVRIHMLCKKMMNIFRMQSIPSKIINSCNGEEKKVQWNKNSVHLEHSILYSVVVVYVIFQWISQSRTFC